jgi:small subunit ribosomal protein S20
MPNIKSAEKRLRQDAKRHERNKAAKSAMRTHIKNVSAGVEEGDKELVTAELQKAMKAIGKNGKKHIIHPKKASRLMSRIQKRANKALLEQSA